MWSSYVQIISKEEVCIVRALANAQNLCGLHVTVGLLLQCWMDRGHKKSDRSYSLPTPGGSFIYCWHQHRGQYFGINTCPPFCCENKYTQYILQCCSSLLLLTSYSYWIQPFLNSIWISFAMICKTLLRQYFRKEYHIFNILLMSIQDLESPKGVKTPPVYICSYLSQ